MAEALRAGVYELDFGALYERMWELASDDRGDGTRLYRPRQGQREALKWLIAELSGTPVDPVRTMPENDSLRRAVHRTLEEDGWADRVTLSAFRLLRPPSSAPSRTAGASSDNDPVTDADDAGETVEDIAVDAVTDSSGRLALGGLAWSPWASLDDAMVEATTSPGVYVARAQDQIVYVGMAGERRGQGVRGRIRTYARGRGAVSGLGEAALDRALADAEWVSTQLTDLLRRGPTRAKDWAVAAMRRRPLELCWTGSARVEPMGS